MTADRAGPEGVPARPRTAPTPRAHTYERPHTAPNGKAHPMTAEAPEAKERTGDR